MMENLFYFGCLRDVGHYFWETENHRKVNEVGTGIPRNLFTALDGTFCPPPNLAAGLVQSSNVGPWMIISWWDNSIDRRPGSHSTFIGKGFQFTHELFEEAQLKFPSVFARQKQPLSFLPN
jgi:hypothetical protein